MSFGKFSKSYFGKNYKKAKRNYRNGVAMEKLKFQRKYPSADISKFVFDADLSKTGDLLTTTTKYRNDNGELFDTSRGTCLKKITSTRCIGFQKFGTSEVPFSLSSSHLPRYRT